jgi:hypothetical protein
VPALAARVRDEPVAKARSKQSPEDRDRNGKRGDRDDRIHSLERVIEPPVALDFSP